jgi:hypothetical protein
LKIHPVPFCPGFGNASASHVFDEYGRPVVHIGNTKEEMTTWRIK